MTLWAGLWVWGQYELSRKAYQEYQEYSQNERDHSAKQIASECAIPFAPAEAVRECLADGIEAYQDQDAAEQDLQAQQDMAIWAFWMFAASIGAVAVSLISVGLLVWSLHQTRQAISNDREIGQAQVRAYIGVQSAEILSPVTRGEWHPVLLHEIDVSFKATVTIKNFGQSPAHNVFLQNREKSVGKEMLDTFEADMEEIGDGNAFVGPGDGIVFEIDNILTKEMHEAMVVRAVYTIVFGRVDYTDVFKEKWSYEFCLRVENYGTPRAMIFSFGLGNKTYKRT